MRERNESQRRVERDEDNTGLHRCFRIETIKYTTFIQIAHALIRIAGSLFIQTVNVIF